MTVIGLIGTGSMGSAIGAGWGDEGVRVLTAQARRSERSKRLANAAGIELLDELDDVIRASDVVVSVVPPAAAVAVVSDVAAAVARTSARPVFLDLNAIAPETLTEIDRTLDLELVDGSISGGPPRGADDPTRIYLAGPRAGEVAAIPNRRLDIAILDAPLGAASALKMCTASMYKGTKALVMQAMITAEANGVCAEFLADTMREWSDDVPSWHREIAVAAAKAWRYVGEMHEIARTQRAAGLPGELFDAMAVVFDHAARTELGRTAIEDLDRDASVSDVIARLR
jgi:3-hydroxyisobutyrate dehydrogenase-like beta-hydroxyacid dehydrogenase